MIENIVEKTPFLLCSARTFGVPGRPGTGNNLSYFLLYSIKMLDNAPVCRYGFNMKAIKVFTVPSRKVGNQTVIIDAEDWPRVQEYKWRVVVKDGETAAIAAETWGGGKSKTKMLKLSRLIMRRVPEHSDVGHLDGNVLNNQKTNLYLYKTYNRKPVLRRGRPVRYKEVNK